MTLYKHGAYGEMGPTQDFIAPRGAATLPVYFGRLPVHQLAGYAGTVNRPVLLRSWSNALAQVGYSDNWADYDLCEAIYAHFRNDVGPVGPIVVINALDPEKHIEPDQSESVTLVNGQGVIDRDDVILSSITITGKVLDTDFTAAYSGDGSSVLIKDLTGSMTSPVTVEFDAVTPASVTETEVIESLEALSLVYQTMNMVPTILDAPAWSHIPAVADALKASAIKINGHWYAFVNTNIDATETRTIAEAVAWKADNAYTGAGEAPCWPMAKRGNRIFHLSTLTTVAMQQSDHDNGDLPYETPSNKPISITGLCLADGTDIEFDQVKANELNEQGIRTATFWGGRWILWGPHTGAYAYGKDLEPRDIFDSSRRMFYQLMNDFQLRYGITVDKPLSRAQVDTILNDYQEYLDNMISRGALLHATIQFNETSNPISDIVEGDFVFDVATTTTPPAKSITGVVRYTSKGLQALFGGEQA